MRLYWACINIGNFGDDLGWWLIKKLSDKEYEFSENPELIICGSILKKATKDTHVFGAGFMTMYDTTESKNIHWVRGHISKRLLFMQGNPQPKAKLLDPGMCLREFFEDQKPDLRTGFVPHYIDYDDTEGFHPEWHKIGICTGVENVIKEILRCKYIVTSSLHAYMIAQVFDRPAALVKIGNKIVGDGTKYFDYWSLTGEKPYKPIPITNESMIHNKLMEKPVKFGFGKQAKQFINDLEKHLK